MEAKEPSTTAISTAMRRAQAYLLDDEPKILVDPLARSLAGFPTDADLLDSIREQPLGDVGWFRTTFSVRSRYTEDALAEAYRKGISQYIILGAGLDSFGYRCPEALRGLHVFEIDHPASQHWKRQRVAELGLVIPDTLHYLPIDFEVQQLTDGLTAGGVDLQSPAFFSLLGVTQYLTQPAVLDTLHQIARASAPGSELVAEFIQPASVLTEDEAALVTALSVASATVGEPWLSYFETQTMDDHLRRCGFTDIAHFGPEEAHAAYLSGRKDGLRLPAYFRMFKATVR